jgi:hypothetical protein
MQEPGECLDNCSAVYLNTVQRSAVQCSAVYGHVVCDTGITLEYIRNSIRLPAQTQHWNYQTLRKPVGLLRSFVRMDPKLTLTKK